VDKLANEISIDGIHVKRGEKNHGFIKVAESGISSVEVPLLILNGVNEGPKFCLIAGTHNCEYAGIEAGIRLYNEIDPKKLSGTIFIIPVINVIGFMLKRPYVNPLDDLNMSSYPSKGTRARDLGSTSDIMWKNIYEKVVSKADYLIDMHGGDQPEGHLNVVYYHVIGNKEMDEKSEELARNFTTKFLVRREKRQERGIRYYTSEKSIPSIVVEAGGLGIIDEVDVNFTKDGILNLMKYYGMIEGKPVKVKQNHLGERILLRAKRGGIFYLKVKSSEIVSEGQKLGEIKNVFGEKLETISSPSDGVVMITYEPPVVNSGSRLIGICPILDY
jgi:predicted deacylase